MTPATPIPHVGEQQVKGALIMGSLWAYGDITSSGEKEQLILELPEQMRKSIHEGTMLPINWYPLDWHLTLLRLATLRQGPGTPREMARRVVRRDLSGAYRLLLRAIGTRRAFELVARLWPQYTRFGTMVTSEASPRVLHVSWNGCFDLDKVSWEGAFGGVIGALESMGAKSVKIEVLSGGGISPNCTIQVTHY